jgi:peptide/nickel transport system substrate-binding protein
MGSGMVLSKAALEEKGAEGFATDPIGTGPYEFVEWTPDSNWVLRRFEDYWGEPPEWDEIHFFPITEDSAAEIAIETGEVDFGRVAPEAFDRFENNPDYTTLAVSGPSFEWLNINVEHPKLQDINVRQAIRYGIDVNDIITVAHGGLWERACAMIAPGQVGHWADAPCYDRDVDLARQYLADAGYPDGLDMKLTIGDGESARAAGETIQAQLGEIGINIEIETLDGAAYNTLGDNLRERELTWVAYGATPDPSLSVIWFLCDQIDAWNWTYYCDPEVDQLAFDALVETDQEARSDMYIEMQRIWDENVVFVWVAYESLFYVSRSDLEPAIMPHGRYIPYAFRSK